ncbi:MAG: VCBS repeat-containing protein [Desulfonauticus sp.]|nr:VCBS repeat-containing protein [Desulfonauticus sp.]
MLSCLKKLIILLGAYLLILNLAYAQGPVKTFSVLPFKINAPSEYEYLSTAAQTMLATRLTWSNHFEPVNTDIHSVPQNLAQAKSLIQKVNTDYLIYGTLTIIGNKCNLSVHALSKTGQDMPINLETNLDGLIAGLETVAKTINQKIFFKPEVKKNKPKQTVVLNSEFVYNETGQPGSFYLNPEFSFAGNMHNPNKWRSQTLPFAAVGMVAGDADKDGQVEIFILEKNKVHAYRRVKGLLKPLATYETPFTYQCLNINLLDLNKDGYPEIIVSARQDLSIHSFMLNFKNNHFKVVQDNIPYFLNVIKTPPYFLPTLIGQKFGLHRLFDPDSVYELVKMHGSYQPARHLSLPPHANVFNFTYLPQGKDYKIIVNHNDHLYVYTSTKGLLAKTEEMYAATNIGFSYYETTPGLGVSKTMEPYMYYISARLIPINLTKEENFQLLVSRPISISSQFFARYRNFPQGEMHCLFWDGVGLNLLWKTRRIKGSIMDYGLYDLNGDGKKELVVCINTYPGATGLSHKRTIIISYTLHQKTVQ